MWFPGKRVKARSGGIAVDVAERNSPCREFDSGDVATDTLDGSGEMDEPRSSSAADSGPDGDGPATGLRHEHDWQSMTRRAALQSSHDRLRLDVARSRVVSAMSCSVCGEIDRNSP